MTGNYQTILAMSARIRWHRSSGPVVDADDLAHTVLGVLADRLSRSSSAELLAERVAKYCELGYLYRALDNESIDCWRQLRGVRTQPVEGHWPSADEPQ